MLENRKEDYILKYTVIILVLLGIIMVFSASYYTALNSMGDAYSFLKKDIRAAAVGAVAMIITSRIPYKLYGAWAWIILAISVLLLVLVLTPMGTTINYAQRWIYIGPISIMPGELAKPAVIIFCAWYLNREPERTASLRNGTAPMWLLMGICALLIMKQPNFSTAFIVCALILLIMIISGTKMWHIGVTMLIGVLAAVVLIAIEPYRLTRIVTFLNPFADAQRTGFQVAQSLIALGSGGLTGVGIGESVQKMLYLPEPMNDFIFAIIGEEMGYIGCLLILILYAVFVWRGIKIALECQDAFGMNLAAGITFMVGLQAMFNIGVVSGTLPNTGVSLPFISWGGNSLLIMMACAGILLNISRNNISVKTRDSKLEEDEENKLAFLQKLFKVNQS